MNFKRTLRVTPEGDIATPNKEAEFIGGAEGVVQELKILLETIRGEDPFAPNHGLRIFEAVGSSDEILEREIRDALSQDDRVASIDAVEIDRETDAARIAEVSVAVTLVDQTQLQIPAEVG